MPFEFENDRHKKIISYRLCTILNKEKSLSKKSLETNIGLKRRRTCTGNRRRTI